MRGETSIRCPVTESPSPRALGSPGDARAEGASLGPRALGSPGDARAEGASLGPRALGSPGDSRVEGASLGPRALGSPGDARVEGASLGPEHFYRAMSFRAITRSGVTRTRISPGTALRRP